MTKLTEERTLELVTETVEPQRQHAVAAAEEFAKKKIESMREELAKHDFDMDLAAPQPQAWRCSQTQYRAAKAREFMFDQVTSMDSSRRDRYDPHPRSYVVIDDEKCRRFIAEAAENASSQYDQFAHKLAGKIGPGAVTVSIRGSHVWGYSILTVEMDDQSELYWKTTMILNCSKLGKVFNQFPSRKVKNPK